MLFSIVVALMVILVTAFWAYQGFFSATIMFFCTLTACMAAFGFYEPLQDAWGSKIDAGIGLPLALMLIFLATLFGLRLATERLIPGKVKFQVYADRAGGALCGLFVGLLLVGTALIAIQMLPMGPSVFGFERIAQGADGTAEEKGFLFGPDTFTAGLVGMLSDRRLGGTNAFREAHPDFIMGLYSGRANPQSEERTILPGDALTARAYWFTRQIDTVRQRVEDEKLSREFDTTEARTGTYLVCRVIVAAKAAQTQGDSAVRFRLPQFRLIGPPPSADGSGERPRAIPAVGMSDLYTHQVYGPKSVSARQKTRLVQFGPATDFILGSELSKSLAADGGKGSKDFVSAYEFDVAFEAPEGFEPWYVEFKRGARAELKKSMRLEEPPPYASIAGGREGDDAPEEKQEKKTAEKPKNEKPGGPKVGQPTAGNVNVADATEERTGVMDRLPVPLSKSAGQVERSLQAGKLGECHFWVELPEEPPTKDAVKEFFVPAGKKMVQIGAQRKDAYSLYGKALNYASTVAAQIKVSTADGRNYFARGVYSGVESGGKMVLEIQYFPESEDEAQRLKKPLHVTSSMLRSAPKDKRMFGYLFIVDPGVRIVEFSSGGMGGKQALNIEVPP